MSVVSNLKWINAARVWANARFVIDLSPSQTKALALLLELRGEKRPAVCDSARHETRSSTLRALARKGLAKILRDKDGSVMVELIP